MKSVNEVYNKIFDTTINNIDVGNDDNEADWLWIKYCYWNDTMLTIVKRFEDNLIENNEIGKNLLDR